MAATVCQEEGVVQGYPESGWQHSKDWWPLQHQGSRPHCRSLVACTLVQITPLESAQLTSTSLFAGQIHIEDVNCKLLEYSVKLDTIASKLSKVMCPTSC